MRISDWSSDVCSSDLRKRVAAVGPETAAGADAISGWDDVKLLTVSVDRLETWHKPGLLFIGDAAHAMSPIGGVGINLAIQDAVAADRKGDVEGKRVSVSVNLGGRLLIKKKNKQ